MRAAVILGATLAAVLAAAAVAQESKPAAPEATTKESVVPYCIEPMESMPENIRGLIEAQFRCADGTHLKRDSRPVRVIPSGEEGRPFVLRFNTPEKANAWYVRGFTTGQ